MKTGLPPASLSTADAEKAALATLGKRALGAVLRASAGIRKLKEKLKRKEAGEATRA